MYPIKEARILTFSPLRITDTSGETYLELSYLEEEIKDRFRQQGIDFHDCEFKIVLIEWEFIYCKVPNGTDYYVDIKANKYRIEELEPEEELELDEEGVCITEDIDVAMALGDRQRSQLHQEFKETKKNLGILSVTPIQNKTKQSLYATFNKELPDLSTHENDAYDDFSNIDYTSANQSHQSDSHFMDIMRVEQLVNAEKTHTECFDDKLPPSPSIWTMKTPNSSSQPNSRVKSGYFSGAKKRGFGFLNLSLLGKREFKEPSPKPLALGDITNAIMNGDVKWEDLQFEKEHVNFIKSHKKMMLNSNVNQTQEF